MKIAGIIVEYDPMHRGHLHLLAEVRHHLGADAAVICAMSGDFVQRGDVAVVGREARAGAAVRSGCDLVVELPLPWALASAERFAQGGVEALLATGLVTDLVFGSESADAPALRRVAEALLSPGLPPLLREELERGDGFAAARQRAVGRLLSPEDAALLRRPNDILGVEYCKALLRQGSDTAVLAVPRTGAAHDGPAAGGIASASQIRALLRSGERPLSLMAPAMAAAYGAEEAAGRAPVFLADLQRPILARLRCLEEEDFARIDPGREGLYHRLYRACRRAPTLEAVLAEAGTKRYAASHLRRMLLRAYLGLTDLPERVPYLRVLAFNDVGRQLLARMRKTAALPVVTKPASIRRLSAAARSVFQAEVRAADLYALGYPDLSAAAGGRLWREGPRIC